VGRMERITETLRRYDEKLFCAKNWEGKPCVYRRGTRIESYDVDGKTIHFIRPATFLIFAITHNWRETGYPVDRGLDPIMAHLQRIDCWNHDIAGELIKQEEEYAERASRERQKKTEDFLYEFRDTFKRTFDDVNVANMDKNKTLKGKRYGNC